MSEPRDGVPVTRAALFSMIADEAFRDGVVEDFENQILVTMARFLRLEAPEAQRLAREARERFRAGSLGEVRPLSPLELYSTALGFVLSDGEVDALEAGMLEGLRLALGIREQPEAPRTSPGLPPPGTTTLHLAARLERDRLRVWRRDQGFWVSLEEECSEPALGAWGAVVEGVAAGDPQRMAEGLDALEDVVSALDGVLLADAVLALRAVGLARPLLRTRLGPAPRGPVRDWPGAGLHARLLVKLSGPLATVAAWPRQALIDEALRQLVPALLEDLALCLERRHAEAAHQVFALLPEVLRAAADLDVAPLALEVLRALEERARKDPGRLGAVVAEGCRRLIEDLGGERTQPRQGRSEGPADRVRVLGERVRRASVQDQALTRALGGAVLAGVEAALSPGHSPEDATHRLVAALHPRVEGWPRPLVSFHEGDLAGHHHEELKGAWPQLGLRRLAGGERMVVPGFPLHASTRLVSLPLAAPRVVELEQALRTSRGAYDVVLSAPGRHLWRCWAKVGDLDPTGTLDHVETTLLPTGRIEEARRALVCLTDASPWLSMAWVQLGLLEKKGGDLDAAEALFRRAHQEQPHDPIPMARLGVLAKQRERFEEAEDWLERCLRLAPTDATALGTYASLVLGRVAGGDMSGVPPFDHSLAGLRAAAGDAFTRLAAIGEPVLPGCTTLAGATPVDTELLL